MRRPTSSIRYERCGCHQRCHRKYRRYQAYYLLDTWDGGFASISVSEDRAGAEESTRAAAKWVAENIADWTPNPPMIIQGDVAISLAR